MAWQMQEIDLLVDLANADLERLGSPIVLNVCKQTGNGYLQLHIEDRGARSLAQARSYKEATMWLEGFFQGLGIAKKGARK